MLILFFQDPKAWPDAPSHTTGTLVTEKSEVKLGRKRRTESPCCKSIPAVKLKIIEVCMPAYCLPKPILVVAPNDPTGWTDEILCVCISMLAGGEGIASDI